MGDTKPASAVVGTVAGNAAIAVAKFAAAAIAGSAAMLAEGIHSAADALDGVLLSIGLRHQARKLYFWGILLGVVVFALAGGMAIYGGVLRVIEPRPLGDTTWSYVVLGIALVIQGVSWTVALRALLAARGERGAWEAVRSTRDPAVSAVLVQDTAALVGLVLAFLGVYLTEATGTLWFDGAAAVAVGAVMLAESVLIARELRGVLVGESAAPETAKSIRGIAAADPDVRRVRTVSTVRFGPRWLVGNVVVRFGRDVDTAAASERLERAVRERHPEFQRVFVEGS